MFKHKTTFISLRYILLLLNFIQLLTIMLSSKPQLLEMSLPYMSSQADQDSSHKSLIVNISLSMTLLICEFLTFGSGFTMFSDICTLFSIFGHLLGNIFLVYFLSSGLDVGLLWWIFPFTYCLPLMADAISTIGTIYFEGIKFK